MRLHDLLGQGNICQLSWSPVENLLLFPRCLVSYILRAIWIDRSFLAEGGCGSVPTNRIRAFSNARMKGFNRGFCVCMLALIESRIYLFRKDTARLMAGLSIPGKTTGDLA